MNENTHHTLKQSKINGYPAVSLRHSNGVQKTHKIHRLMAITFGEDKTKEKTIVDHINRQKADNASKNLRWVTLKQNSANINRKPHSNGRKVRQLDLDGNEVQVWPCVAEAARQLGIDKHGISNVCLGKQKTASGFLWKYVEEEIDEEENWIEINADIWVSDLGRLYYPYGNRYARGSLASASGYRHAKIDGVSYGVHILVAKNFIENKHPSRYSLVNHKDGDRQNNRASNLEWASHQRNTQHAVQNGLLKPGKGPSGTARKVGYFEDNNLLIEFKSQRDASKHAELSLSAFKVRMKKDDCPYKYIDGKKGVDGKSEKRRVSHYARNGELLGTYNSIMDAVRETGYCRTTIQQKLKIVDGYPHNDNFRYAD